MINNLIEKQMYCHCGNAVITKCICEFLKSESVVEKSESNVYEPNAFCIYCQRMFKADNENADICEMCEYGQMYWD